MDEEEKYIFIEKIYGAEFFSDISEVLKLLNDEDELVRIEMIEACYATRQSEIKDELWNRIKKVSGLEKGCLLLTLSYIYRSQPEKMEDALIEYIHSEDEIERLDALVSFVILGKTQYIEQILSFLKSSTYQIRCRVCNLLSELVCGEMLKIFDIEKVEKEVIYMQKCEKTEAVKSSMKNLLKDINAYKGLK